MRVIMPALGFSHNPLNNKLLRNKPCVCNSGKKTKACHGRSLYVLQSTARLYSAILRGVPSEIIEELAGKATRDMELYSSSEYPSLSSETLDKAVEGLHE